MCISAMKSSRWRLFERRLLRSARIRRMRTRRAVLNAAQIPIPSTGLSICRGAFCANGLYYNIEDFSIWDFVAGVSDVRARRLKLIGDPETRYREDPVRMLRAVRFAAKLDFSIEPVTEAPIAKLAYLLDGVPPARLFDECLKLFLSGFGAKAYGLLKQYGLFEHLFPLSAAAFALPPYSYAQEMLQL